MKPVAGIAICIVAGIAWAQNDELTPRQIFDFGIKAPAAVKSSTTPKSTTSAKPKPVDSPPVAPAVDRPAIDKPPVDLASTKNQTAPDGATPIVPLAYAPLALRYSILQRKGNAFEQVDPNTEFHSGDRIRLKVEANGAAYLYIVMGGSSGQWRVLFPSKEISGGNNHVEKGQACTIPPESDPAFYFDETAGVEKVSLVLSRTPEPDLEKLIYAAGDPTRVGEQPKTMMAGNNPIDNSVFGPVREKLVSRDLVFEKYDGPAADGTQEKAVYAATRNKSADARLFVDLKLIHK
jgi:hypothetical protein